MEYPGTKFTRPVRLTMLIVFIFAFFIISPTLIMYTAGYRYDWHNGLLKETGSINIDIEPKNATAYLNNVKLSEKIPIRLNNITPAKYNLRITASGYYDWTKEIEIRNKQTSYTKEISLIRKNKPEILINEKINNFAVSYDGKFILYTISKNMAGEIWLWNNTTKQKKLIYNLNTADIPAIDWAENNNYAIISDSKNPYSHLILVNAENPVNSKDLAQDNPSIRKFQWNNTGEPQLYFSTQENIYLYTISTNRSQIIGQNKYMDWSMDNGQLWTIQLNTSTAAYEITKDTLGFNSLFNQLNTEDISTVNENQNSNNLQMLAGRLDTVLVKINTNSLILVTNNNKYKIAADKFLISKYNNWWLLWSQWELWTYSQGEEPNLLNRSGEQLKQVLPLDRYNTLALVWEDRGTVLFPYYYVSHDLINEKVSRPAVDTENKILYFINANKEGIWKLNY
jgi:hypothetical protein